MGFLCDIRDNKNSKEKYLKTKDIETDSRFIIYSKVNVNGPSTHPLYQFLRKNSSLYVPQRKECKRIESFGTAFLLDKNGNVIKYYKKNTTLNVLKLDIQNMLLLT